MYKRERENEWKLQQFDAENVYSETNIYSRWQRWKPTRWNCKINTIEIKKIAFSAWDTCNKGEIDQREMVQCRAARFVINIQLSTSSVDKSWTSSHEDRRKDA